MRIADALRQGKFIGPGNTDRSIIEDIPTSWLDYIAWAHDTRYALGFEESKADKLMKKELKELGGTKAFGLRVGLWFKNMVADKVTHFAEKSAFDIFEKRYLRFLLKRYKWQTKHQTIKKIPWLTNLREIHRTRQYATRALLEHYTKEFEKVGGRDDSLREKILGIRRSLMHSLTEYRRHREEETEPVTEEEELDLSNTEDFLKDRLKRKRKHKDDVETEDGRADTPIKKRPGAHSEVGAPSDRDSGDSTGGTTPDTDQTEPSKMGDVEMGSPDSDGSGAGGHQPGGSSQPHDPSIPLGVSRSIGDAAGGGTLRTSKTFRFVLHGPTSEKQFRGDEWTWKGLTIEQTSDQNCWTLIPYGQLGASCLSRDIHFLRKVSKFKVENLGVTISDVHIFTDHEEGGITSTSQDSNLKMFLWLDE